MIRELRSPSYNRETSRPSAVSGPESRSKTRDIVSGGLGVPFPRKADRGPISSDRKPVEVVGSSEMVSYSIDDTASAMGEEAYRILQRASELESSRPEGKTEPESR